VRTFAKFVVKSIEDLIKGFQELLNFLKKGWPEIKKAIDETFVSFKSLKEKLIKSVKGLSKKDLDWMSARKPGDLGGKILKESQIRRLRGLLKEKGIILIVEEDLKSVKRLFKPVYLDGELISTADDLFYYMRKNGFAGGFDGVNKQLILPKDATELVAFHEMAHVKQFEELGDIFHTLETWEKETYVWEQIWANRSLWTNEELQHSLNYVNSRRKKAGIELLKITL